MIDQNNYLGIDPGISGGLALLRYGRLYKTFKMPVKKGKVDWEALRYLLARIGETYHPLSAGLEKQQPFAILDKKGKPMVMFGTGSMLENYGRLKLLLDMAGIVYHEIPPRSWRAAYNPRTKGKRSPAAHKFSGRTQAEEVVAGNRSNKQYSVQVANSLWPGIGTHEGVCEAALIGEFYRRKFAQQALEV